MSILARRHGLVLLVLAFWLDGVVAQQKPREIPIEVLAVTDFPLNVQRAALVKTDGGYRFRCQLSNTTESEMMGLRYSLALEQSNETPRYIVNRSEAFKLKPYETQTITFPTQLKITPKQGQRIVLMVDQAVSSESIWEVAKAREAFDDYLNGNYSTVPTVIHVANHVDAPLPVRVIFQR